MIRTIMWGSGADIKALLKQLPGERFQVVAFICDDKENDFPYFPMMTSRDAFEKIPAGDYDAIFVANNTVKDIRSEAITIGFAAKKIITSFYFIQYISKLSDAQFISLSTVAWWYHSFEILPGVTTPGTCIYKPWLLAWSELNNLTGKNILDIGAWDGPYTLEMTRRGANVTAFDIQPPENSGFNTMKKVNGIDPKHINENVYNLSPIRHGTYDLVTFLGVYYHSVSICQHK